MDREGEGCQIKRLVLLIERLVSEIDRLVFESERLVFGIKRLVPRIELAGGLVVSRWAAALVKTDFGLYGVVGGMMVIALLAFTMRPVRGRNAAVSLSMGSDPMGALTHS